jgi:hypothetical protein
MLFVTSPRRTLIGFWLVLALTFMPQSGHAYRIANAGSASTSKPETVEWVYRIRYGSHDEWFEIFRKYQIAILERQKQLGYVLDYTVWAPGSHTSEESRWDYRIVITRASHDAPPGQSEAEVAKQLFPDQTAFRRDENRRWELTTNHWDLPIHQINPSKSE